MSTYTREKPRSRSPLPRSDSHDVDRSPGRRKDPKARSRRDHSPSPQRSKHVYRKPRRSITPESDEDRSRRRRYRDRSPKRSKHHNRSRSRSRSHSPKPLQRSRGPLPPQNRAFEKERDPDAPVIEKEKPNWARTGKLAAAANTVQTANQTIVMKYHEPIEARKPPAKDSWRMYVFKNGDIVDTIQLSEQSCWLFGREMAVADIPVEHPSCSKQHAVIQFRYIEKRNEFGDKIGKVKPYLLDLESSHGTFVNDERIPDAKYVEVRDKDVVKFGNSRREYIMQLPSG